MHLPLPVNEAEDLTWYPVDRPEPGRVLEYTCHRHPGPSYELLLLGGGYLIRRTGGRKVYDTTRVPRRLAYQWWQSLLTGWAK